MHISTKVVVNLIGKVGATVAGSATMLIIALVIGPAPLGTYALVLAVSIWAVLPIGSIAGAVEKRTSESNDGGYLTAGALLGIAIACPLLMALIIAGPLLESYTGVGVWYVVIVTAARAVGSLSASNFIARGRADLKGLLDGIHQLARFGAVGAALVGGWGLTGVLIAHAVTEAGVWFLAVIVYSQRLQFGTPTVSHATSLLTYARHFWLNIIRLQGLAWTDTLVLGAFVSPVFIGIYELGWRMARILSLVSKSIKQATLPEISTAANESTSTSTDDLRTVTANALAYPGLLAIPGVVGVIILGNELFVIFGDQFLIPGAGLIFVLLVFAELVGTYADQLILGLYAGNQTREAFRVNAIVMGVNTILNVVLVSSYGWVGAAVATLFASSISLILGYWWFSEAIGGLELPLIDIRDQILAATVMGVGLLIVGHQIQPESRITVLLSVALGSTVYFVTLVVMSDRIRHTVVTTTNDLRSVF